MSPIVTPANALPYAEERRIDETPLLSDRWLSSSRVVTETGVLAQIPSTSWRAASASALLSEGAEELVNATDVSRPQAIAPVLRDDSALDSVNSVRLQLLARKYAQQQLPREQEARLEIATQKVLQLIPSATEEDYAAIEELMSKAAVHRTNRESARRLLAGSLNSGDE